MILLTQCNMKTIPLHSGDPLSCVNFTLVCVVRGKGIEEKRVGAWITLTTTGFWGVKTERPPMTNQEGWSHDPPPSPFPPCYCSDGLIGEWFLFKCACQSGKKKIRLKKGELVSRQGECTCLLFGHGSGWLGVKWGGKHCHSLPQDPTATLSSK